MLYQNYEEQGNRRRKYRKHQRGRLRYEWACHNNGTCAYCYSSRLYSTLRRKDGSCFEASTMGTFTVGFISTSRPIASDLLRRKCGRNHHYFN